jgi:phosphate starvation-inducible protein PhoH and related proteins
MSSKRRKAQAFIEKSHDNFLNEAAKTQSKDSKISTSNYIHPANPHQKQFVKSIKNNILTVASGEAGCGKSLLALFTGIQLLNNPESPINKIAYVRSHIRDKEEAQIGAIPGSLSDKMRIMAYPILDNLESFMSKESINYCLEQGKIEVLPFMFMRGRSFQNTFIICDETQNCTKSQLKTLLTRICESSKLVIIGDITQCDIDPLKNGLKDLEWRLNKQLKLLEESNQYSEVEFDIIKFDKEDILRSELTKFAINLYDL